MGRNGQQLNGNTKTLVKISKINVKYFIKYLI